jgi:predicted permease
MNSAIAESLPVISLVVVGFLLKEIRILIPGDGALFSRIILNITLSCVIFLSISRADIDPSELLILALCGLFVALVLRIFAGGVTHYLKLEDSVGGVVILASMVQEVQGLPPQMKTIGNW